MEHSAAGLLPLHDASARKVHQWTMVALVTLGFVLGEPSGAVPLFLAGAVMLVGRFWWPADVVRQLTWRVLEPRGLEVQEVAQVVVENEDHSVRAVARVLGGAVWLLAGVLLLLDLPVAAWVLALAIAVMVVLDAAVDFCALCFAVALARR